MAKQVRVAREAGTGRLISSRIETGGNVVVTSSGQVFRSSRDILFRSARSDTIKGRATKSTK
jgi:hypothetical protein